MKIVKYILSCIIYCIDAWVGKSDKNGGIKEGFIGLGSLLFIILLFFASLIFLDKKTNMSYKTKFLCSVGITLMLVLTIFVLLIIFERVFYN